jgi:hypothetical protein
LVVEIVDLHIETSRNSNADRHASDLRATLACSQSEFGFGGC